MTSGRNRTVTWFALAIMLGLTTVGHSGEGIIDGDVTISSNLTVLGTAALTEIQLGSNTITAASVEAWNAIGSLPVADTAWDGGAIGLDPAQGRSSLGLGSAATSETTAFAPADLTVYAGDNLMYSNNQFHAQISSFYADADATNAVAMAWPNLDTDSSDDLTAESDPLAVHADGTTAMTGDLNLGSNRIVNVSLPQNDGDAVSKAYMWNSLADIPEMGGLSMGSYTNR